jgi:hypothetical protein
MVLSGMTRNHYESEYRLHNTVPILAEKRDFTVNIGTLQINVSF